MNEPPRDPAPSPAPPGEALPLWGAAAAVAILGSWILFDALPGINWVLWTAAAVVGLLVISRRRGPVPAPVLVLGAAAIVIAGAAAVTASEPLAALICLAVVFCLAMLMLLTAGRSAAAITARFAVTAPPVAAWTAAVQALRQAIEATQLIRSPRARAWVRGLAITVPVLLVFALLLAGADPLFAAWRDALGRLLDDWAFVPRTVFFLALLVIVLGAYGHASLAPGGAPMAAQQAPGKWLGATERLILLTGVAALLWLFLAVQLGYLFGNLPQIPASGVTFAEYARRGFAELTVVASATALLIVVSERYGNDDGRGRVLRFLTLAVIAAVLLLLGSALRRVWLYEEAYGFTTARLYAQFYMGAVAAGLALLAFEVAGDFDGGRVFRRAVAAATILFVGLIYWNHEAWIAGRNIGRFASSGQLDVAYLATELSADALPAIAERLASLPEPVRTELREAVRERYARRNDLGSRPWYEWNLARSRGREALRAGIGIP